MLRMQKCAQRRSIYHFPTAYNLETFQGVPLDYLGVDAVEIEHIIAPDHRRHRQEAPKRIPTMPAAFSRF